MDSKKKIVTTPRQSNIELLRILAMFGIVIFHHFGRKTLCLFNPLPTGFEESAYFYDVINNCTSSLDFRSLVLDFCYGHFGNGGNLIFMLITGYFLFGKDVNLEKRVKQVIKILFIVVFWGCVLTIATAIVIKYFYPFGGVTSFKPTFNLPNWLSGKNMWYLQAYCIFILIIVPLLKHFEHKIDQKRHKLLIAMLTVLLLSDYQSYIPNIWLSDKILEFVMCYYIGGYVKKYRVKYSLKKLLFILLSYIVCYFLYEYYWRRGMRKLYEPYGYSYVDVMEPLICTLIFAVIVFLIFSKINFSSRIVNHISRAIPGIYIFHYNMTAICFAFADTYLWHTWSLSRYIVFIIIDSVLLFFMGYLIDLVRQFFHSHFQVRMMDAAQE